jgi:hypothetical protein
MKKPPGGGWFCGLRFSAPELCCAALNCRRQRAQLVGLTPTAQGLETGNEARCVCLAEPANLTKEGLCFGERLDAVNRALD